MIKTSILDDVRPGLIIAILVLLFGILMGVALGIFEETIKDMINSAVDAHPSAHTEALSKAKSKIFRWWQRAHFHATGIGAFTIALIAITALSSLNKPFKKWASLLIGIGSLYPFSWFLMSLKGPSLGRPAAHHYLPAEIIVFISIGCLLAGMAILLLNIIFNSFRATDNA